MNTLIKLTRQDIENKYKNKPILIICKGYKNWYIVSDIDSQMPLYMLNSKESDLYDKNESNIDGIQVTGIDGNGYLMWIYFEKKNGWEAYGYE